MSDDKKITIKGNINAGNVNFGKQTFKENVTFNMSPPQNAGQEELKHLYEQLAAALAALPAEKREDVEAVQKMAQDALDEASKPQPNKTLLTVTAEGLKQAAQNLLTVAPIAAQIAKHLMML